MRVTFYRKTLCLRALKNASRVVNSTASRALQAACAARTKTAITLSFLNKNRLMTYRWKSLEEGYNLQLKSRKNVEYIGRYIHLKLTLLQMKLHNNANLYSFHLLHDSSFNPSLGFFQTFSNSIKAQ